MDHDKHKCGYTIYHIIVSCNYKYDIFIWEHVNVIGK